MAEFHVRLMYPLDDEARCAWEAAGIVRRTGSVYELEADDDDDARSKVLAVQPDANITHIRPAGAGG
jgi:hypothetical protein